MTRRQRWFLLAVTVVVVLATAVLLNIGIWTQDDRWAQLAGLVFVASAILLIALGIVWDIDASERP